MKKIVISLLMAIVVTTTLFIDLSVIDNIGKASVYPFTLNIFCLSLVTTLLGYLFYKITIKKDVMNNVLAILFTLFMIVGNSYQQTNSIYLINGSPLLFILSVIMFLGYYYLFMKALTFIKNVIENRIVNIKSKKPNKVLNYIFNEKPFLMPLLILIIFWLIYIIAFYPTILSPDPSNQIKQYFNVDTLYIQNMNLISDSVKMTTHHPVLHTFLLGSMVDIGKSFGNANLGLFFYSLIQLLVFAGTLAFTIKYMKKLNIAMPIRVVMLAIYALVPMYPFYAMSAVKDTIFTALIILYVIYLFDIIKFHGNKLISYKRVIVGIVLLLLIAMFRNNGIYMIFLSFPFIFVASRINIKRLSLLFVSFVIIISAYNTVLIPSMKISPGSVREMLSVPFQQTARYVRNHEEELSAEDKKIIDATLNYKNVVKNYDPVNADKIKNRYIENASLKTYFKVWAQGLKKHPETYISATVNNTYGYFYPNYYRWYIYYRLDSRIRENNFIDYHYNNLTPLRSVLSTIGVKFPFIPVLGMLSNIGFNTWMLFFVVFYFIALKKKKYIIAMLPLLAAVLVCVASPINAYFRYAMPYIFAMPLLFTMLIAVIKDKK